MECSFFFEIFAPDGLEGINSLIENCCPDFYVYRSGFNGKNILKSKSDGRVVLGMDTSTSDIMHGGGHIESDFDTAKQIMESLHTVFIKCDFPHKIGVDDENGESTIWMCHKYS